MKIQNSKLRRLKAQAVSRGPSMWLAFFLLVMVGIVAYWNSFDAPLVFDDFLTIQKNEGVRLGDYLSTDLISFGNRQLLYFTLGVNYAIAGQNVWGYHLFNLILHLINGILILFVAMAILRQVIGDEKLIRWYAILAAGIFLTHPVQTESVTYISSRSELLSTFFYILAFLVFIKVPHRWIGLLLSLIVAALFTLGMSAKETILSLPGALFAYDFIFISKGRFRPMLSRWKFYSVFMAGGTAVGYYLVTGPLSGAVGTGLAGHLSVTEYFLTQLRVIVRYIRILFFPVGLNLDYDIVPSTSVLELGVLASLATLLAIVFLAWRSRFRFPVVSFSIFWFFITLAPTSSFMPITDVMFEHRLYLPMVGLCLSFPIAVGALFRFVNDRFGLNVRAIPVGATIIVVMIGLTILRNEVWRDETTLWADVIEKSPRKARGYNALAMSYFRQGDYESGLAVSREGLEKIPAGRNQFVDTIGNIYLKLGRYDEAADAFRDAADTEAAREEPDLTFVENEYNNLGVTYLYMWQSVMKNQANMTPTEFEAAKLKVLEPALEAFSKSLSWGSQVFTAVDSYVNVMSWLNRGEELSHEHEALLGEGEDFRSRYILAKLAFNVNDFETAIAHLEKTIDSDPIEPLFWFNYGYALDQVGRLDDAIQSYNQAIRLNAVFVEAHHNVGLLLMRKKKFDAAIPNFEEVLRLYPQHVSGNLHLAKIYLETGDRSLARQHLATVLNASPDHQEALSLWQQLGS